MQANVTITWPQNARNSISRTSILIIHVLQGRMSSDPLTGDRLFQSVSGTPFIKNPVFTSVGRNSMISTIHVAGDHTVPEEEFGCICCGSILTLVQFGILLWSGA